MAKFENYANQSATMGVTWRRGGELRELSNQRTFQIHWKNEKKTIFLASEKMQLKCLLKLIVK